MKIAFYSSDENAPRAKSPVQLPPALRNRDTGEGYLPDAGLAAAVNVALLLGRALLVTGEPGTGKTQLAWSVAWQLGYPEPLVFEAKSNSSARDLFYTYDAVGRFHSAYAAQNKVESGGTANGAGGSPLPYITFNALGAAILRANPLSTVQEFLPTGFIHGGPARSIVLIDEVDKAPRDLPNDILNEIDNMYFRVPELDNRQFSAPEDMRPIVIITSNSEKSLPDAFLRRCAYYHLPFPSPERLEKIVASRVAQVQPGSKFLSDALDLFKRLRSPQADLRKKPATAELINFVAYLRATVENPDSLRDYKTELEAGLSLLAKLETDQIVARSILDDWLAGTKK